MVNHKFNFGKKRVPLFEPENGPHFWSTFWTQGRQTLLFKVFGAPGAKKWTRNGVHFLAQKVAPVFFGNEFGVEPKMNFGNQELDQITNAGWSPKRAAKRYPNPLPNNTLTHHSRNDARAGGHACDRGCLAACSCARIRVCCGK